jgi:integrase
MAMARRKAPRVAKATPAKKVEKRLLEQEVKNLERALKEERTGLVAVARIVLGSGTRSGPVRSTRRACTAFQGGGAHGACRSPADRLRLHGA